MTALCYIFGHLTKWVYADNGDDVDAGDKRPCPRCGKYPTPEGHDPCIRNLPGVVSACCGHGVEEPFIMFDNEVPGLPEQSLLTIKNDGIQGREIVNAYLRHLGRKELP